MNESYAPMLEHLDELRTRIVRCALALLLGMVVFEEADFTQVNPQPACIADFSEADVTLAENV